MSKLNAQTVARLLECKPLPPELMVKIFDAIAATAAKQGSDEANLTMSFDKDFAVADHEYVPELIFRVRRRGT